MCPPGRRSKKSLAWIGLKVQIDHLPIYCLGTSNGARDDHEYGPDLTSAVLSGWSLRKSKMMVVV